VNLGIYNGAGKAHAKIAGMSLHKFAPKYNQATDWPHSKFNVINILDCSSRRKNRAETRSRYGATNVFVFTPVSLV
jgi:hypothetical protein